MARMIWPDRNSSEVASQAPRIVAITPCSSSSVEHHAIAEFLQFGNVDRDRFAPCARSVGHFGRNGLTIGDHPIDDAPRDVTFDGAKMSASA